MAKIENKSNRIEPYLNLPSNSATHVDDSNRLIFLNVYDQSFANESTIPPSALANGSSNTEFNESMLSDKDKQNQQVYEVPAIPPLQRSISNPYFNIRLKSSDGGNYPLTDTDVMDGDQQKFIFGHLTAIDLINNPRGASIFSPEDFLYVKNYNLLPVNRLITLRRFAFPVFDDIFGNIGATEPDISRMITYSDSENNKLSDILSFTAGLPFKELNSASEKANMEGTDDQSGISGIAGNVMRFVDPKYGREAMMGNARVNYDPQHDQNRVYGPVDSIASTHIRNVGIDFTQSMTMKFNYQMKSHNGINQKAAFMDLLANIIMMITNDAKFWGGARYWVGPKPSSYMGMMKKFDSTSWQDFVGKASTGMKETLKYFSKPGNAKAMLQNIFNNAMNLALGNLLNVLGRTGIPIMNSLLSGNPVGPWHITVGNPMNPTLVAGDLIIDMATVRFGDELGFDDFPTEIEVEITLKHAKPRGRAEIENMFNCGKGRIYLRPKDVLRRNNSTHSSKENPVNLTNALQVDTDRFGDFDDSAIKRNSREVWSFTDEKVQ